MTYEIHLTFKPEQADEVKEFCESCEWKFSTIYGDPILGAEHFCYASAHEHNPADAFVLMERMNQEMYHLHPIRSKIELIIYDTKTGIGV